MARQVAYFNQHASVQNKLNAMAGRLKRAKALVARGEAEVERIKRDFYALADGMFGPDTYVLYECRGDLANNRMVREIQEPRIFDVEGMACDDRIPFETLQRFTEVVVKPAALDIELAMRRVDSLAVAEHTMYGVRPSLLWTATGARSEVKPKPGQIAVISSQHLSVVRQEGAA